MESEENKYYVYCLVDPINDSLFYIGKGCDNRDISHLKNTKEKNGSKNQTIQNIRLLGFEPKVYRIVENLKESDAYDMEYIFIKNAKYYGINLTNRVGLLKPPSRKGCKLSEKTKLKISKSTKGISKKPMSDITKQKLSHINRGKDGPNKIFVDVDTLRFLYISENKTKLDVCNYFSIGLGSLNRILKENNIMKTKECFSIYAKRK